MGRYKKNYGKIKLKYIILFFIIIFPINIYSTSVIEIDGYLKEYDIKKFSDVLINENLPAKTLLPEKDYSSQPNKKELFIILNSSGGKLKTLFKIIDNLIKIKKRGIKIYTIVYGEDVAYAGAFLIILFSDIVFYSDLLNLGTFTPLSKKTYELQKNNFDRIFKVIGENKVLNTETVMNFFFDGNMFRTRVFKDLSIKFIRIESLEDIEFSVASYKNINLKKSNDLISYLFTPNFIFFIFNLTIILVFLSVYFTKNIMLSILSIIFISIFVFLSFEITISLKSVFAIFFTHFMLIFKEYVKFKYIIFILSFTVFILSSIFLINPLDSNYYIDTGFRVNIFIILIMAISVIIVYKVLIIFFNKRYKKFSKNRNELKYLEAFVSSSFPLTIKILGDDFPAESINKLYINNKVKVIGFRGIKIIVERL